MRRMRDIDLDNARFDAACEAWDAGRDAEACTLFLAAAVDDVPHCALMAGYFLDEGIGVAADKALARRWYLQAWRDGVVAAASNIALQHEESGEAARAVQWFRRGAAKGDGDAELELAKRALAGHGCRRSLAAARAHLMAAAASTSVTPASREEAQALLLTLDGQATIAR